MHYYNSNQIERMKVEKNELVQRPTETSNIQDFISQVLKQFEPQINQQNIKIFIAFANDCKHLKADWVKYELILFNILQNAVKYNRFGGEILILLRCLPMSTECLNSTLSNQDIPNSFHFVLETEIIDSGLGISKERQKMLFEPFLELKIKQNLKQVQNFSTGMGLACSSAIAKALGGDITLKKSKEGISSFAFKIPVLQIFRQREAVAGN